MPGRGRQRPPPRLAAAAAWCLLLLLGGARASVENPAETREETRQAAAAAAMAAAAAAPEAAAPLEARVARGETTRVIVTFRAGAVDAAAASANAGLLLAPRTIAADAAAPPLTGAKLRRAARRAAYARLKSASLRGERIRRKGARVVQELNSLPVSVVSVNSTEALDELRADPNVAAVFEDQINRRMLLESLPAVGQPAAAARGFSGAGCSVAVIDGGGDIAAADLGSCTGVSSPSSCRVDVTQVFTNTRGFTKNDPHATNVASIVARVAPGARMLLLDVFENDEAFASWIYAALDWVSSNASKYNICAVNLSLGNGVEYTAPCADNGYEAAFAELRARGVIPVVASGNEGRDNGLSQPACAPSCVSVGATWDSGASAANTCAASLDKVACFSNVAPYLDMLAPGAIIAAGGYNMSGTSMATPHVAGAVAVLKAAKPDATSDEIVNALKTGGTAVVDWGTKRTFPRLNIDGSLTLLLGETPREPDTAAPTATVRLNGGAPATSTPEVSVAITAQDNYGPTGLQMCVSAEPVCLGDVFTAFQPKLSFALPPGDGPKTVYVWLRDAAGNTMADPATASITLDSAGPVGTVTIAGARSAGGRSTTRLPEVEVLLTAAGAKSVCFTATDAPAALGASCSPWQPFSGSEFFLVPLAAGGEGQRTVRAVFKNAAGAVGPEASAAVTFDTVAPMFASGVVTGVATSPNEVQLSWDPADARDETSGVERFIITYRVGGAPPKGCTTRRGVRSTEAPIGAGDSSATIGDLRPWRTYRFRLCAVDAAGNVSPGVLGKARTQRAWAQRGRRGRLLLDGGGAPAALAA